MTRLRQRLLLSFVLLSTSQIFGLGHSQERAPASKSDGGAEKWLMDRKLTVTAKEAAVPALKYRLFPLSIDRKDGNAVPIYLRFAHERNDATKQLLREKTDRWNELPLDKVPVAEARQFLSQWGYNLRQLELGARRKSAEWNYTLDAGSIIDILLPDVQEMRIQANLLLLKARVEILEDKLDDALRTLETGFSFSKQLSDGPFLINSLVGVATANRYADCLLDFVERPKAPNLYWALSVLPQPVVDLRHAIELEYRVPEMQFPDLADLERLRTPEQWDAVLVRIRKEMARILATDESTRGKKPRPGTTANDSAAKSPDLPVAKQYLVEKAGYSVAAVEQMSPAQILVRYLASESRELREDYFRYYYLPFVQARPYLREVDQHSREAPETEGTVFARTLNPNLYKVLLAQNRLERKLKAIQTLEAVRMHAAKNHGRLPETLQQIKVVPVPKDPGTDEPFEYHLDGPTTTLSSRVPDETLATNGLRYQMTIRK